MPRYKVEEELEEHYFYDNYTPPESPKTPENKLVIDVITPIDKFHRDAVKCFEELQNFVEKNHLLLLDNCSIKDFMNLLTE